MEMDIVNALFEAIHRQQQVMALVARMEGMKAENEMRRVRGEFPAYGEDSFFILEDQIINAR